MTPYQDFIFLSRYARYLPDQLRRETWQETVDRYIAFFNQKFPGLYPAERIRQAILTHQVMPSMRALMTAGPALAANNIAGYNCAYLAVDHTDAFHEALLISMNGTGVGFSVERQFINQLPTITKTLRAIDHVIKVEDSKEGWSHALQDLIYLLYGGLVPRWDLSLLRSAGAPLKTFGGRSSGPGPLHELFSFTVNLFNHAAGRRLESIECHDLMCKIGMIVKSGGVRRSAMISLSNLSDLRMRQAKHGQFWTTDAQRVMANNSVAYTETPEITSFLEEWHSLIVSKAGERGIYNRAASQAKAQTLGRSLPDDCGTNPCGEISLRNMGFCNLSEVVARPGDDFHALKEKVELATIIGTFQACLTHFPGLREQWRTNAEQERLLGVSITGIMDHPVLRDARQAGSLASLLMDLRAYAWKVNQAWAEGLAISPAAAITCVKPSGTVSQLVNSSSGMHGRYAQHYLRTVRQSAKDPLSHWLKAQGVPCEPDLMDATNWVFSFPVASPAGATLASDLTALQQLEHWLIFARHWADHNPSVTIYVKPDEWLAVAAWVWDHFDECNGLSFLPAGDGHVYLQAPYQAIDEAAYQQAVAAFPALNLAAYQVNEHEDFTTASQELACSAGGCEL